MGLNKAKPVNTLDGKRLKSLLVAGIRHVFQRRDYLNRINVFPVPDGDTGTNMAFTFKSMLDSLNQSADETLSGTLNRITEAALDGARGNSGAIMAQFFQGCRESIDTTNELNADGLAVACVRGSEQAWTAMSEPVPGTLPTVLEDFAAELQLASQSGVTDLRVQFERGLARARASLENTPNQLPALKAAGVVDAGGQGFVDLLEGINTYIEEGIIDPLDDAWQGAADHTAGLPDAGDMDIGDHRFCTECVIEGEGLDRLAVMRTLEKLDSSSLVVAGSDRRVRVHIHVNKPAEVYLACEQFGEIAQQKADDMSWQHGLLNQPGHVAVVTDSGADVPAAEAERLGIQVVPVRLNFGEREYLDGVSLKTDDFYQMLQESDRAPRTSQPPAADFRRVYDLLTGHGYEVMYVGLSTLLSGTTQAARSAADRSEGGKIEIFDTLNASCGQGLLALAAAEAASEDQPIEVIHELLERLAPLTHTLALPDELTSAVRGGRVPAWVGKLAGFLRIMPILRSKAGKLAVGGVKLGRGATPAPLARRALAMMDEQETYRVMVSHCLNPEGAREVRRLILAGHDRIHSCHLADAGPALGVHLGVGGLLVGFMPDPHELAKKND